MPIRNTEAQITDMGPKAQPTANPGRDVDDAPCTDCERPIGETGRWYPDDTGGVHPYCVSCAQVEFPVL